MIQNPDSYGQPIIWSISALDNSAGAGIAADIRTAGILGIHLCPVATAITAQNNQGVWALRPSEIELLDQQCRSLLPEFFPAAIKVGLLPNREIVIWLAEFLKKLDVFVVADTPMLSSSGGKLVSDDVTEAICEFLFPHVDLLSPNYNEAEQLANTGYFSRPKFENVSALEPKKLSDLFLARGVAALYLKGGHAPTTGSENCDNVVHDFYADREQHFFLSSKKIDKDLRGTGCSLATAIAAFAAKKNDLVESIVLAKDFINQQYAHTQFIGERHYSQSFLLKDPSEYSLPSLSSTRNPSLEIFKPLDEIGFYPILDDVDLVAPLLELGIKTIQLRIKDKNIIEIERSIELADQLCKEKNAQLFINDYWQIAIKYRCFGVHLGQEDLLTANLTEIAAAGLRLGISSHCFAEAARVKSIKPSYVALGPIFETTCKSMRFGPQGFEKLAVWKRIFPNIPLVAIGGLKREHIHELKKCNVDGVAVISDFLKDANPLKAAAEWVRIMR